MKILGIDPGTRVVGWGVVERSGSALRAVAWGTVRATGNKPMPVRLRKIHDGLRAVIEEHRPDAVGIEEAFFGKSVRSALALGEGRGAAMLAAGLADLDVHQFPPSSVKKAVTGKGNAAKEQVAAMVKVLLGLPEPPTPADAADALAVAICALHRA
ncbi:MAG: crossover junction endodeoxyribonuclease RuvC [Planctomycetota bacterium]|jgi:crossover junction endodeoxyribonuclease RuvC